MVEICAKMIFLELNTFAVTQVSIDIMSTVS